MKCFYILLLLISLNACVFDSNRENKVKKINLDVHTFNSIKIDSNFNVIINIFKRIYDRNTMGRRKEKIFRNSKLKSIFTKNNLKFDINKLSIIETKKKFFKNHYKEYGCSTLELCYVSVLWYDGIRETNMYKYKGMSVKLQGDFEVIIAAIDQNKTRLTIIGYDLALNLGTKCCSLRTLQPYDYLYKIKNEMLEQSRVLMYIMDSLNFKKIHFETQNNEIISWYWRA